jgi:4-amino-4-deoxy-L-arabinose transferase-like glycosyltransferase
VLRKYAALIFFLLFAAILLTIHLPYLRLPYHWDELGQFVPTALDLYHGAWVAHSTLPNVHPPGVAAILALAWRIFGYSIPATRLTMLAIASLGVTFAFLLAIRLSRTAVGAPAFAAAAFLILSPMFYMQSEMVLLDMPAMTFTLIALWLFLDGRFAWCAVVCTALVLMKETAITTPLVFAAWLWFSEKRRREALYFLAPLLALGAWLLALHHATGYWTGNAEFAQYNIADSLHPKHILKSLAVRVYFLFIADGHWIGTITLFIFWRELRGKAWNLILLVALAQFAIVTLLGGAYLERYLFPILPILYIAIAVAGSAYPASWRRTSQILMALLLTAGWFVNPPFPFHLENNLAAADFVLVQRDVAQYIEASSPRARVASTWPFTEAISRPEFGYVHRPLETIALPGFQLAEVASVKRTDYDLVVVFPTTLPGEDGPLGFLSFPWLRRQVGFRAPPSDDQFRAGIGLIPLFSLERRGMWVRVYAPPRE